MRVLSLFDGMSCGRIALERMGITPSVYYASEIDKYAIQVARANYPDTIHVGDVTELKESDLPKIDLLFSWSVITGILLNGLIFLNSGLCCSPSDKFIFVTL